MAQTRTDAGHWRNQAFGHRKDQRKQNPAPVPVEQHLPKSNPLFHATENIFDHLEQGELRWHLRDLLMMATRSDVYKAKPAEEAETFFNATLIIIENLDQLAEAFDVPEKEVCHA